MKLTKKTVVTILIGIVLLGAILRFYRLGATSFVADEFLDINSSVAYAKTGVWQNWDFNFNRVNTENVFEARDSRAWIYKWQVAQILKHTKINEANARMVSVSWGIITIILMYFTAAYFTKRKEIGLISAFLFAVSISGIIFDRRLRMYAMFYPVFLAFSWLIYKFYEDEYKGKIVLVKSIFNKFGVNVIYLVPALALGVASVLTHQLAANIVFAVIIFSTIQLFRKSEKFYWANKYFLSLLVLIAGYIGAVVFFPEELSAYTAGISPVIHQAYFAKIFSDYSHIILASTFLLVGIYYLYKKEKLHKEAIWLASCFGGIFAAAVFLWDRNTGDQYIFFIQSFGIILIASGIYGVAEFLGNNLSRFGKKAFYIPLALFLVLLPNYAYFFQESNAYKQTSEGESANYKKVFGYFMKAKDPEDVLITRNFRNFYWQGAEIKVFDFGGELAEKKLSLAEMQKIVAENPSGWFIFSDNDDAYVANDAMDWAVKNMERVSNSQVRGKVSVYQW